MCYVDEGRISGCVVNNPCPTSATAQYLRKSTDLNDSGGCTLVILAIFSVGLLSPSNAGDGLLSPSPLTMDM